MKEKNLLQGKRQEGERNRRKNQAARATKEEGTIRFSVACCFAVAKAPFWRSVSCSLEPISSRFKKQHWAPAAAGRGHGPSFSSMRRRVPFGGVNAAADSECNIRHQQCLVESTIRPSVTYYFVVVRANFRFECCNLFGALGTSSGPSVARCFAVAKDPFWKPESCSLEHHYPRRSHNIYSFYHYI